MSSIDTAPGVLSERERALDWLTAASPILLVSFCFYGWRVLGLALLATAGYVAAFALLQWAGLARVQTAPALAVGAWSALLLSAATPLWVAAIAGTIAAVCAYLPDLAGRYLPQARPLLHPVLLGYAAVALVCPALVRVYTTPALWAPLDAVPSVTPLAPLTDPASSPLWHLFIGLRDSALGTGCAPILLLAFGYLLLRRRLRLIAPGAMLVTVTVLSWMIWNAPLHGLLAGSTLLAAILLADRACAPETYGAQAVCGVVAGVVTILLRALAGTDGCAVGVLAACLLSPVYPPLLRILRRGAVWLWGILCRYIPPAARWIWGHLQPLVAKLVAFWHEKICKKQK